jgi:hypothetical protein
MRSICFDLIWLVTRRYSRAILIVKEALVDEVSHRIGNCLSKWASDIFTYSNIGNFVADDLKKASPSSLQNPIATRIQTEICGVYPKLNEVIVTAGLIVLGQVPTPKFWY